MVKKRVVKRQTKKTPSRATMVGTEGGSVERVLVENFVSLQRVMADLSSKFDNLANQISKLLELFEISAKTLAQKDFNIGGKGLDKSSKELTEKLDNLLDQNKTIARGLALLHDPNARTSPEQPQTQMPQDLSQEPTQQVQPNSSQQPSGKGVNFREYQKSVS